ncbi:MAG: 6-carboxytetrahydropterin synthase, partial [Halobacteriovoraceae bacterium]|nr:6-carboxytetrahydropterin synthase [Halobacteriovoraceae bacterium]
VVPQTRVNFSGDDALLEYSFANNKKLTYRAPRQAICSIPSSHVNKENIQCFLENIVLREMPQNITAIKIFLYPEESNPGQSMFHYTHGLKQHYGNCQRLFHGHRNTVTVKINGEARPDLEKWLARDVFKGSTHFCFFENVENSEEVKKTSNSSHPEGVIRELPEVKIKYKSGQGVFQASIPGDLVYFLQDESTVENLSFHFANLIKSRVNPLDRIEVWAFEGIGKGAYTCLS